MLNEMRISKEEQVEEGSQQAEIDSIYIGKIA